MSDCCLMRQCFFYIVGKQSTVTRKLNEPIVKVMSDGYSDLITISLNDLEKKVEEEGTRNPVILLLTPVEHIQMEKSEKPTIRKRI